LKVQLPDVIILDVMMPMVDGLPHWNKKDERLRHCKSFPFGKKQRKHIEKDFTLGANLYVVKPFSVKKLVKTSTGEAAMKKRTKTPTAASRFFLAK
jgi:DNA-binding response OmpR family regulator